MICEFDLSDSPGKEQDLSSRQCLAVVTAAGADQMTLFDL
jgi:hypothetical protein